MCILCKQDKIMFKTDGNGETIPWRRFTVERPTKEHYRKLIDDMKETWSDIDDSFTSEDVYTSSPETTWEVAAMNEIPDFTE